MSDTPFGPQDGGTVTIAASTTSADESIVGTNHWLRIVNPHATAVAHIKAGEGAQTATANDFPVGPGSTAIMKISPGADTVAALLSTGTGNVYVTPGTPKT
jgi:hypothetical protein